MLPHSFPPPLFHVAPSLDFPAVLPALISLSCSVKWRSPGGKREGQKYLTLHCIATGIRNATSLPDQQHRRFVIINGLSWSVAQQKCAALGTSICPTSRVCKEEHKKKEKKDALKTGGKNSRLTNQLCRAKGWTPNWKKSHAKKAGHAGKMSVCKHSEEADLANRWLPLVEGGNHVWANIKTCESKPSVEGEKEQGVVACCGGPKAGAGLFAAVHPPQILVAAVKSVKQRKADKVFENIHVNMYIYIHMYIN